MTRGSGAGTVAGGEYGIELKPVTSTAIDKNAVLKAIANCAAFGDGGTAINAATNELLAETTLPGFVIA